MQKFRVLCTFIYFLGCFVIAESKSNDEIYEKISKIKNDKEKVIIMNKIADSLFNISVENSKELFQKSIDLASSIRFKEGLSDAHYKLGFNYLYNNEYSLANKEFKDCIKSLESISSENGKSCLDALGFINYTLGEYNKAHLYYTQLLNIYLKEEGHNNIKSNIYTKLGNIFLRQNKYYSAQEMYLRSLNYAKISQDKGLIADCYVNMSIITKNLGDYDNSKKYCFQALKINKNLKDTVRIANNLANISKIYIQQGLNDSALIYLFQTLKLLETSEDKVLKANILADISAIFLQSKKYDDALEYALQAKRLNQEVNYLSGYYWDLINLAKIYIETNKNLPLAKQYLDSVHQFSEESDFLSLSSTVHFILAKYFYKVRNIDSSNYYWSNYTSLLDTIFNFNTRSQIADLESKFRLEKKFSDEKIQNLKRERSYSIIIISLIAGALTLLIVAFVIWWERRKSEKLLQNVLPKLIATRLKTKKKVIADSYKSASIVFFDIIEFTNLSKNSTPERIVYILNKIYTEFDHIAEKYGLEKIKTIGDCYMAAAGVPIAREDHAEAAARFALESMEKLNGYISGDDSRILFRCGIDCGPIVAGVIGEKKFIYDLWGDAVNTASRMEEYGVVGKIQCTERFKKIIQKRATSGLLRGDGRFDFVERGEIEIKGKGLMKTYFLTRG
jgi:class 3 adenylate cyclase/tetratricopeptide (TPR) repeat protein